MQVVIDIPEEEYERMCKRNGLNVFLMYSAIANGTPLPKGHGDLIDRDTLEFRNVTVLYGYDWEYGENTYAEEEVVRADDIWNADAIIEADKGSEG